MAIKSGSIMARPTKYGAKSSNSKFTGFDAFVSGTGPLAAGSSSSSYAVFLYGMDFRTLQELKNPKITSFTLTASVKNYSYTGSGRAYPRFITDFETSGTNVNDGYTDVGGGYDRSIITSTSERDKYYKFTVDNAEYPNLLMWMNSNVDKVINGYTTNSFGIRLLVKYQYVEYVELTLNYTYEVPEPVTVTTNVSPAGTGTVTPTHQVESGSTATVAAIPNAGYKFSHWLIDGADSGVTSTTLSGVVDSDITVTAVFVLDKINKNYVGTSQLKEIYVGTTLVKEVYVGTTKVYG